MACLFSEEVLNSYQCVGKVVNLAVCGMERKVPSEFARVFHVLSGRGYIFIWLECLGCGK